MSLRFLARHFGVILFGGLLAVAPGLAAGATIGLNFTGVTLFDGMKLNSNSGYAPPDNAGGVGPGAIAQLINGAFAVYDKNTGALVKQESGRDFWLHAGVDPGNQIVNLGAFNQRILYDPTSGRWIAAALTGESVDNSVLLARSETSDPAGAWKAVSFLGNVGGAGKFVDYTRLGVDANGVYIATDNFPSNSPESSRVNMSIFSVPKTDLMAGDPILTHMTRFDAISVIPTFNVGSTPQPIINFGAVGNHAPVLSTSLGAPSSSLTRFDLLNTAAAGATHSAAVTKINVIAFPVPPLAAQPDGTHSIDTIDARFKSNVYQVGNIIYAAHDVNVNGNSGIRWYKIDETNNQLIQEGVIADPNYDFYMASIAANADGDVVIGFNRSGLGPDGQISIMAATGTTAGSVTTFGAPFLIKASAVNDYHYTGGRWGDYTTTMVDPSNPKVFWTFQEYALNQLVPDTGQWAWATNITQIIVPEPEGFVIFLFAAGTLVSIAWRRKSASARVY